MWLFLAFLAGPLIEIALFVQIGGAIGLPWTLLIVVLTAILGTFLVRNQGMIALGRLRTSFSELRDPTEPLAHGAMILFSGALLLTPGFFTDAVGFAFLIPQVRSAAFLWLRGRVKVSSFSTKHEPHSPPNEVYDAEFEEVPSDTVRRQGPSGWTKD
ncbi:MAG: FxsA family protein [Paracoccaceae bacterium]